MEFPLPPMGEGLYEVELVRWLVKPGDSVKRGQSLMEVLSDKATMEVPSPFSGVVTSTSAEPGTKIRIGDVILDYESEKNGVATAELESTPVKEPALAVPDAANKSKNSEMTNGSMSAPVAAAPVSTAPVTQPIAAPSVRHLARKLGVDLTRVRGSGPAGRILLDDLAPFLQPKSEGTNQRRAGTDLTRLDFGQAGTTTKLMGLRRKIAEKMVQSKRSIPHYSYMDECDISDLVRLRSQLRAAFSKASVKLTYLAFFVKAVALALKEVPIVNSTFDEATETITLHDRYHIGVAVATPSGLIVPVVKDADRRDLIELAREIERVSEDARNGRSKLEDLRGSTFTITSVGGIGGLISTPIINHPEVGIMGVGKIQKRPVYDEQNQLRAAEMVYLSFSFDHRIVDGAVGVAFGNAILHQLQNPALMLLPQSRL